MADYYKTTRSRDWNYGGSNWRLSRSKIDLFMECPRCFYIDNKLGLARPKGPAFTLNVAVDELLKKEFDMHRTDGTSHPLMKQYGVEAIPFAHDELDKWRHNFTGVQYFHKPTGFLITGAIDDVWKNKKEDLIVVDYKATSKEGRVEALDDTHWQNQYKRQMEVYQWLLRRNGFPVSNTGYFVYVNGKKDKEAFDGKLEFDVTLIAHEGNDSWIEKTLEKIKKCLDDDRIPGYTTACDYCRYIQTMGETLRNSAESKTVLKDVKPKKATAPKRKKKVSLQEKESKNKNLFD